jgi:hypothetical protein
VADWWRVEPNYWFLSYSGGRSYAWLRPGGAHPIKGITTELNAHGTRCGIVDEEATSEQTEQVPTNGGRQCSGYYRCNAELTLLEDGKLH